MKIKLKDGRTAEVRDDWAEDYGIKDFHTLQRAARQAQGGINVTIDGKEYLFHDDRFMGNAGLRSGEQQDLGTGFLQDAAGFVTDHKAPIGIGGDNFNMFLGALGAGAGLGALTGTLGGAGAAGLGEVGSGAISGGGAGGSLGSLGYGEAGSLLGDAMSAGGLGEAGAAAGANALGVGAVPGVAPAATGGFSAAQLGAAGLNPSLAGLGSLAGPSALGGLGSITGGGSGPEAGNSTFGIPNNVLQGILQGVGGIGEGKAIADAYRDVNNQFMALGAPSRARFEGSFAPGFMPPELSTALGTAADTSQRALSTQFGNPADSNTAQAEMNKHLIGNFILPQTNAYRSQNLTGGGLGVNTAGTAGLGEAGSAGIPWGAVGTGIGTALNQAPDYSKLFQQFGLGGNNGFNINVGGMPFGGRR